VPTRAEQAGLRLEDAVARPDHPPGSARRQDPTGARAGPPTAPAEELETTVRFVPVLGEGHVMPGVYADLCGFVLAHGPCTGPRHANAGPPTVNGYRLSVVCGCGTEFTLGDA
jgi:hypothetical protein